MLYGVRSILLLYLSDTKIDRSSCGVVRNTKGRKISLSHYRIVVPLYLCGKIIT
jgi:hypothetical protein